MGELGIRGSQIDLARNLFLELVNDIACIDKRPSPQDIFTRSRTLANALGEQGVQSREVLELLKHALTAGRERLDKTESQLYAESCQVAALEVMAHLSDFYRQNRVRLEPPAIHRN